MCYKIYQSDFGLRETPPSIMPNWFVYAEFFCVVAHFELNESFDTV